MKKVLVLGATGGMGFALVEELVARGIEVVAFSRNKEKLDKLYGANSKITTMVGNALLEEDLTNAVTGIDVIFHAVSFPYQEWKEKHLPCLEAIIKAAASQNSKIVLVDNIYAYGRQQGERITEDTKKVPHTEKGKIRLKMENTLKNSNVPWLIGHLPDLFGPNAENTILYETLKNVSKNKVANFVGNKKIKREFLFTRDGAKALVELALREEAYYQNWNIPSAYRTSGDDILNIVQKEYNYNKSFRTVSKSMIQFMGFFQPFMKEMVEMMYLTETPILLSGIKYEEKIGTIAYTSYKEGIAETLDWIKNKA